MTALSAVPLHRSVINPQPTLLQDMPQHFHIFYHICSRVEKEACDHDVKVRFEGRGAIYASEVSMLEGKTPQRLRRGLRWEHVGNSHAPMAPRTVARVRVAVMEVRVHFNATIIIVVAAFAAACFILK
eukprot:CAMPEP_0171828026 /NCGR_PEP_ID=MMETSP0992-20121227/6942_1 /TAXON_ID=483369 /ORGANISM="non described non described, Strain CCMP2098" /LENGTH=127 /DNA_ID=CAMNT_0012443179 /DNA_START=220 /DNA_END=602 /DNA_ORIENTATION=-